MFIRKLEKSDYSNYVKLISQFRPITINIDENKFNEIYEKIFQNNEIYVAVDDKNNILGSITVLYEQKFIHNLAVYAHIEDVIVDENHRHLRIGSKLLYYVKTVAKEKKCYKISLVCNDNIKKFYLNNNFEEKGLHMTYLL